MFFVLIKFVKISLKSSPWLVKPALALGVGSLITCLSAFSANNNLDAIKQSIQSGQLDQALRSVQQERQTAPKDVQVQFLEGVILAQQGQHDRAIEAFKKMTEAYPDLPEPYNNLGVLYASKGRLEEARAAFDKAILTHASYAAAHKNLSDVQAQLTRQSYARALQVDPKVKAAAAQLTLLGAITTERSDISKIPGPAVRPATSNNPVLSELAETPSKGGASSPKENPAPSIKVPVKEPAITASAKPEEPNPEIEPIKSAVQSWAQSWSRKDMKKYFAAYASNFAPPDNMTRAEWESERELRIVSKKKIQVAVSHFKIDIQGNKAKVNFSQVYESDNFKGNSRKSLELTKQGGHWLITRETVN